MKDKWRVVHEIPLINQADQLDKNLRRQLFSIGDVFRDEGPDAYSLDSMDLAGVPAWDQLGEPCIVDFWVPLRQRWWRCELEIQPGKTVIFRRARHE